MPRPRPVYMPRLVRGIHLYTPGASLPNLLVTLNLFQGDIAGAAGMERSPILKIIFSELTSQGPMHHSGLGLFFRYSL